MENESTGAEIQSTAAEINCSQNEHKKRGRPRGGQGRLVERLARQYGVSASTIQRAEAFAQQVDADPKLKQALIKGENVRKILHKRKRAARTILAWVKENYSSAACSIEWGGDHGN